MKQTALLSAFSSSVSSDILVSFLKSKSQYFANNSGLLFIFSFVFVTAFSLRNFLKAPPNAFVNSI